MYPPSEPVELPSSYEKLNLPDVLIKHVPEGSPSPTKVLVISLYRPKNNNAFTRQMQESITTFYTLVNADDRVKAVVLTGHGKMFCAGADLDIGFGGGASRSGGSGNVAARQERNVDHRDGGGRVSLAIHQCSKPTIAALQGSAVGVGITMCLPATIRVAYKNAKIGFVFARRGIIMEACSHFFLPKLIGLSRAMHLCTTGGVYPAEHPLMRDLFSEVLPTPEATVSRAMELADDIANNTSTVSTKLMRDMMLYTPGTPEEAHLLDSRVISGLFGGPDNTEGVKSFFEKRPPNFSGTMKQAPQAWPWWSQVDVGYKGFGKTKPSKL